jgi:acetyltransferase-like isoleucine patch superfamily enzyme
VGLRSLVRRRMYTPKFWAMGLRFAWLRLRRPWIVTHGMAYMARGVEIRCTRGLGRLEIGREVWIGRGTALRCHEGLLRVGDRVVFGGRDTVNCYLHVELGSDCILADEVYIGDFDHRSDDSDRPIQQQGIVKSPVRIGADCWLGTKSVVLRGTTIGEGSILGANAVAHGRYPEKAVIVGNPGRVARLREG